MLLACSLVFGLGGCAHSASLAPGPALREAVPAPSPAVAAPSGLPTPPVQATSSTVPPAPEPAAPGATSPGADGYVIPATPAPVAVPPASVQAPPVPPSSTGTPAASSGSGAPGTDEDLATLTGPAIYLVAIDDGGRRGARFGCNDSLVAVRSGASGRQVSAGSAITPQDPMAVAIARLLGADSVPAGSNLYNALAASGLTYVSGRLDGATAVVDLRGELRQGGVCDSPRIDAQLTQTAIAATGASRADIRINGRPLAELLDLR
ncbi:GerMN domain-containing protein [Arthrobacter silvisoli]|uniref:GerMN domain-containing protein n=1 Tax=Arthrobacter silvisoli TaxID=2291022 RepID=UPI000E2191AD|nr:GerMN domain-containing protein [Arthrobacter silvisoli]